MQNRARSEYIQAVILVSEAVLDRQSSATQLLSPRSYLVTPLLNFLGIKKIWPKIDPKA
jgi:hypothetical protein